MKLSVLSATKYVMIIMCNKRHKQKNTERKEWLNRKRDGQPLFLLEKYR